MADLHQRLAETLAELVAAVGADGGAALYRETGDGLFELVAEHGRPADQASTLGRLLHGRRDRQGQLKGDARTLLLPTPGGGVLVLARRGRTEFTQQDAALARLYVRQLSDDDAPITAAHGRSPWARQLEAIQGIGARLSRLATIPELGATICTETRQVIDYDSAQVLLFGADGRLEQVASSDVADERSPRSGAGQPDLSGGPAAEAVARAAHGGVPVLASQLARGHDHRDQESLLVVPLHHEGRISGVICLCARGERFDDDDLRLLQILAGQAAVAIENARLMMGRDKLVQELAALLEVSTAAGRASDEIELAGVVAARMRSATNMDSCVVWRWDETSTMLRLLTQDGAWISGQETIDAADSPDRRDVLREGRPRVIQAGDTNDAGALANQLRAHGGHTLILLPLNTGTRTIGLVELFALGAPRRMDESEMQTCEAMASLAATGLERVRLFQQLQSAADVDLVTGVHNHRYLQERLRQEVARTARGHGSMAVLMLDLDRFKPVNDRHGHANGDRVLSNIAAIIRAAVRTSDIVARYGGDEFVVVMPDAGGDQAEAVARRVVAGVRGTAHELADGSTVSVGISAGLSIYPADGRTSAQLLAAADAAMYAVKRSGGGQVERSTVAPPMNFEVAPASMAG